MSLWPVMWLTGFDTPVVARVIELGEPDEATADMCQNLNKACDFDIFLRFVFWCWWAIY